MAHANGAAGRLSRGPAIAGLVGFLVLSYGVAAFGSQFTPGVWYARLDKPAWTPPSWVFGPVWTLLYGMMAVAAWLVWREHGLRGARIALAAFAVQLALNGLWSWIFFGLERTGAGAVWILLLWVAIVTTLVLFWRRDRLAGVLLVPYLAWVSYATALNLEIWRRNG